jgi:hypothetical protein
MQHMTAIVTKTAWHIILYRASPVKKLHLTDINTEHLVQGGFCGRIKQVGVTVAIAAAESMNGHKTAHIR